jgi:tetratricopeptide (TPR) repeat protein
MAPEQANFNALDVDTRADIFALGIILYELLTGTTPITRDTLKKAALEEMLKLIREQEAPTPSSRLSSADSTPSVAANRQTEPAKLGRLVKGELDWIVLKALAKERDRRYETAVSFAKDVERFLNHEPVTAGPPSAGYRLRKFVRRNRGPVIAAGLVLLALVIGFAGTTWGLLRAEHQRQLAEEKKKEAEDESDAKDLALRAEKQARADEAKARQQAFAALRSMTTNFVERKFAQGTELTEDDRAFLRGIIAQFDAFAELKADDPDSRALKAEGRYRVGTMRQKLGELVEAEKDYNEALSIQKQLVADCPNRPEFRRDLAGTFNHRGILLVETRGHQEAEKDFDQALSIQKQLADDFRDRPEFRRHLATSYSNRGKLLYTTGQRKESEEAYDQAVAIQKQLAADFRSRPEFRQDLANSHINRGILLFGYDRWKEAEQDYNQALNIRKQLVAEFPLRPEFRQDLAGSHQTRAFLLMATRRREQAEQDYDKAVNIYKQLAADFPLRPELRQGLAKGHLSRGQLRSAAGRRKDAEKDYDQALSIQKQLVAEFPTRHSFRHELVTSHLSRGMLRSRMDQRKEAEQDYDQALSIQKQALVDFPKQPDRHNDLADICLNLASIHNRHGDWAAAKRLLLEGRPHHLAALQANPHHSSYRMYYRNHLKLLIPVHAALLEPADAIRTAETMRDLGWNPPSDACEAACFLSRCIPIVAKHDKLDDKQRKEAVQFYGDAAMKMLREGVSKGWKDVEPMKKDPNLDPLRQRDDFKKLFEEVQAAGRERKDGPLPVHP